MQHADHEPVLLLGVVLPLVGTVRDSELVEGGSVPGNLGVQGFLDEGSPLYFCLAFLNLTHDSVNVLQFLTPLPEHLICMV